MSEENKSKKKSVMKVIPFAVGILLGMVIASQNPKVVEKVNSVMGDDVAIKQACLDCQDCPCECGCC